MGLLNDNYCPDCGQNLTCQKCGGTGEVGEDKTFTFCCGAMRTSSYCPVCGKSLTLHYSKKRKCPDCLGGRIFHICLAKPNL